LTGTLIQNRINELWAIFDFLMPMFLGSAKAFTTNFANPISKSQLPSATAADVASGISKLKLLHQQVLPFILRREKQQVLPELPQMTQTIIKVSMSKLQERIYHDFCTARTEDISTDLIEASLSVKGNNIGSEVLKALLFLRLLCTHPSLILNKQQRQSCPISFLVTAASGKFLALAEILRGAINFDDNLHGADNDTSLLYCDDGTDDQDAFDSMVEAQDSYTGEITQNQGIYSAEVPSKCLIFAQFTKSLDAVEEFLFKAQMPTLRYCRLDGSVPLGKRMAVVNAFQDDPTVRVLLLTTRVGGVGLNLTSASTVIFLEIDFNPYADLQAQDRCMRIGQMKQVNVYRIITKDSIEEKIMALQDKKIQVTEAIVNNENSTIYSMGTDRLLDVVNVSRQTAIEDDPELKLEYDLDSIAEQCANDYKNLSVDHFKSTFIC
jgi:TATA-binding protein-associated factor